MPTLHVRLIGTSPLMVSDPKTVNPLHKMSKELKKITGKRTKSDEDHEELLRLKFIAALYHDEDLGPYLPTRNVKRAIQEGAKKEKAGKIIENALTIFALNTPILYDGPREIDELYGDGTTEFVDVRDGGIAKKRIPVCRPIFRDWWLDLDIDYDVGILNLADFKRYIEMGGKYAGLGTYRSGGYGRFKAEYDA